MKLGEAMYKAQPGASADGAGATAAPPARAPSEDVVDADFEEIPEDERKKLRILRLPKRAVR